MPGIILLGLGPGEVGQLTRQAWDWLNSIQELYLRTLHHPVVEGLPKSLIVKSFDDFYKKSDCFEEVYQQIIVRVIALGQREEGVTYAVPGHPFVAEATCPAIYHKARKINLPVRVIEGISFLEPMFSALELDPFPRLVLVDALELCALHVPNFPPDSPAVIAQIYSRQVAAEVKLTLSSIYPDEHPVRLVHGAGTAQQVVEVIQLYEIDRSHNLGLLSSLYIPPLGDETSFESFQEVIAHLRAEDGCPWDKEQTHLSLRNNLLEETYEALEALDEQDVDGMCEEFGDLFLQIVLHAQIASEEGEFSMADILQGINRKIVRRHPHVFGDVKIDNSEGVTRNWEKIKSMERSQNGKGETQGLLDGVPRSLPGLAQAQAIQERARRVGFDLKENEEAIARVCEEMDEVRDVEVGKNRAEELGDLLFAMVNVVRWYNVDAESALREAVLRFRNRFAYIEKKARDMGKHLQEMELDEMDVLWEEAKKLY
jgi:tetrapyrrole methylase family protein/MazG family protein